MKIIHGSLSSLLTEVKEQGKVDGVRVAAMMQSTFEWARAAALHELGHRLRSRGLGEVGGVAARRGPTARGGHGARLSRPREARGPDRGEARRGAGLDRGGGAPDARRHPRRGRGDARGRSWLTRTRSKGDPAATRTRTVRPEPWPQRPRAPRRSDGFSASKREPSACSPGTSARSPTATRAMAEARGLLDDASVLEDSLTRPELDDAAPRTSGDLQAGTRFGSSATRATLHHHARMKEAQHVRASIGQGAEDPAAPGPRGHVAGEVRVHDGAHRAGAVQGRGAPAAGPGAASSGSPPIELCELRRARRSGEPAMGVRIECDFRHGLADPAITRDAAGPSCPLAHGRMRKSPSRCPSTACARSWLAVAASVGSAGC